MPEQTLTNPSRCRFDMFVALKPGEASRYPNHSRTWCHRGDKYTNDPAKMLPKLLQMLVKHYPKFETIELYDNTRPKNDPERIVVRYSKGVIERNRLKEYQPMLQNMPLPDFLRY